MKPIEFDGCNCVYAENQKEYLPLPVYKHNDDMGSVSACWELTIRECLKVLLRRKIYITLASFNNPLTPHKLDVVSPVPHERVT